MVILPFFVLSYYKTTKFLTEIYSDKFSISKSSMLQFFIFELSIQLLMICIAIGSFIHSYSNNYQGNMTSFLALSVDISPNDNLIRDFFLFYICFFPAIQAAGLVLVKCTVDPLGNISKLDYLKMVSIN
jgi:hypothetical protein